MPLVLTFCFTPGNLVQNVVVVDSGFGNVLQQVLDGFLGIGQNDCLLGNPARGALGPGAKHLGQSTLGEKYSRTLEPWL